jgi:hypothetical protein
MIGEGPSVGRRRDTSVLIATNAANAIEARSTLIVITALCVATVIWILRRAQHPRSRMYGAQRWKRRIDQNNTNGRASSRGKQIKAPMQGRLGKCVL